MTMAQIPSLPGIPEPLEDESEESVQSDDPAEGEPPDESPYRKTYIAIDGIQPEMLLDDEVDCIEREVTDLLMLDLGKPITGVRVLGEDTTVVEFLRDNAETDK